MPVPVQYISNYGFLGVAKEATFGTPLPATDYFAFESEGFETDPGVLPVPTIRGTRAENNTFYLGEIKTVGKIAMPFYPTSGMRLLAATFGSDIVQAGAAGILTPVMAAPTTSASGGVLAAATYSYRISAINANGETTAAVAQTIAALGSSSSNILTWSASAGATGYRVYGRTAGAERLIAQVGAVLTYTDTGLQTPTYAPPASNTTSGGNIHTMTPNESGITPLTVEKALATLTSQQYTGCLINKAAFKMATNAPVKVDYDIIGQVDAQIAPSTPSYVADTPYALANIAVSKFGLADPNVHMLDFEIDNGIKPVYTFSGQRFSTLNYSGARKIVGKLTTILQSMTDYNNAMAGTPGQLVVTLTQGASSCTFTLPKIVWGKPAQPLKIGELIYQEIPFTAYYLPGTPYDIQAVVVNNVPTAY